MQLLVLLIVVADVHLAAECHRTVVSLFQTVDDFQYSCLSSAVISDHCDFLAALDLEIQIGKKRIAGE